MEPKVNVECLRQQLRKLGHIYSVERENFMYAVYSMEGKYSLQELFQKARKQNAIHAKSTIHRNIGIFLKAGFRRKIESSGKRKKYETITFMEQESGSNFI